MRTFREKFEEFYNSLYECQQWRIVNEYADGNNYERVYDMDEFNEVMSGYSPLDIARHASTDFNPDDKYFHFDGHANLQSGNNCCEWTDFDAMADWYEWHDHILLRIDREEWESLEEEQTTELIPTWAICALINDDFTGLEDEDIEMIKNWQEETGYTEVCPPEDDPYFTAHPAFGLACDVYECVCR